ncbi:MAG: hypothetical protein ACM3Y9_06645 [Ignavibacteria bacterium]
MNREQWTQKRRQYAEGGLAGMKDKETADCCPLAANPGAAHSGWKPGVGAVQLRPLSQHAARRTA